MIFWDLGLDEIYDLIDSFNRREQLKQKQRAIDNTILANQIINGIAILFSDEKDNIEQKNIWDYYPELFEKEKIKFEEECELEEFENFKKRRKQFAYNYNKKIGADG
ncbi:hypothetical protein [Thomasclavelia spiroformis]|uniref:hypothetical protein n=1 Tax=Thomasclavelia spiroformis TaxID=29348 RepID=UPI003991A367